VLAAQANAVKLEPKVRVRQHVFRSGSNLTRAGGVCAAAAAAAAASGVRETTRIEPVNGDEDELY
jgi:hypothetical protein